MYDLLVFIARAQPLHKGHQEVIEKALSISKKVLVLIGSANSERTLRNPFTYQERASLIQTLYPSLLIRPLNDNPYNDTAWMVDVKNHVKDVLLKKDGWQPDGLADFKIGLIGCNKDSTSFYLKMFPEWGSENVEFINPLNATAIRKQLFEENLPEYWEDASVLSRLVHDFLVQFQKTEEFALLLDKYDFIQDYQEQYGKGPFLTADTLVQVGSKILIIRRGGDYGYGKLALPGGFVDKDERFQEAALRELREEVRLKVPEPVLRGSIINRRVFDSPHRSERARLVTECFHIKLDNETTLPKFKRDPSEVAEVFWMDIADLDNIANQFFEDHYFIIKTMLGLQ